jgi:hypothetical protein
MSWKDWELNDWNNALVQKIFFDEERLEIPITRINASDRFLADCVDESATGAEAQAAFINAFGKNVSLIKRHYVDSPKYRVLIQRHDIPTFFPALYLTLLAASADNNTFEYGQFRDRFSELLKPLDIGSFGFTDLPKFWRLAADWSKDRHQRLGDCRVLQLPDPLHERLIGYSKRLAFPTYKDERLLKTVLEKENLNSNSDFKKVSNALYKTRHKFSDEFKVELEIFTSFVAKSFLQNAFDSPLWGAIRDILWTEDRDNSIKNGSLALEMHDLHHPEFSIFTDVYGKVKLSSYYQLIEVSQKDKHRFSILMPESENLLSSLNRISELSPGLKTTKLWKAYTSGLICFFSNDRGYLTTDGVYSDGAQSCFLLDKKLSSGLVAATRSFKKRPIVSRLEHIAPGWELLAFESLSRSDRESLSLFLPHNLKEFLDVGWRPPAISIRGGAWFGQALLLNPSSNPTASFALARSGCYELIDKDSRVIQEGQLDENDEGFIIPYSALLGDLSAIAKVRYTFEQDNLLPSITKVVPLIYDIPLSAPLQLINRDAWLVIGGAGRLQTLSTVFQSVDTGSRQAANLNNFSPYFLKFSNRSQEASAILLSWDGLTISNFLYWIDEALALRFQGRITIPYEEIMTHLTGPASILGVERWQLRNLLFLTGRLVRLESRRSSYLSIAAGIRTISLCQSSVVTRCRIVGGLSSSEIYRLSAMLTESERILPSLHAETILAISALEVEIGSEERILDFANELNLQVLNIESFKPVITPVSQLKNHISKFEFLDRGGLEFWDIRKSQWLTLDRNHTSAEQIIIRMKGYQRNRFWVLSQGVSIETDSEVWAKIFLCAVLDIPIGQIFEDGTCVFNNIISDLPESLTRWWLHWGGGVVAYSESKELMFLGQVDPEVWSSMDDWVRGDLPYLQVPLVEDYAMDRRKAAIKKKLIERNKDYYL